MKWFNLFKKKEVEREKCLICEKTFFIPSDLKHTSNTYRSDRSVDLCNRCVINFVDLKKHLRSCLNTKFLMLNNFHDRDCDKSLETVAQCEYCKINS